MYPSERSSLGEPSIQAVCRDPLAVYNLRAVCLDPHRDQIKEIWAEPVERQTGRWHELCFVVVMEEGAMELDELDSVETSWLFWWERLYGACSNLRLFYSKRWLKRHWDLIRLANTSPIVWYIISWVSSCSIHKHEEVRDNSDLQFRLLRPNSRYRHSVMHLSKIGLKLYILVEFIQSL
jgi:hypothetical protein